MDCGKPISRGGRMPDRDRKPPRKRGRQKPGDRRSVSMRETSQRGTNALKLVIAQDLSKKVAGQALVGVPAPSGADLVCGPGLPGSHGAIFAGPARKGKHAKAGKEQSRYKVNGGLTAGIGARWAGGDRGPSGRGFKGEGHQPEPNEPVSPARRSGSQTKKAPALSRRPLVIRFEMRRSDLPSVAPGQATGRIGPWVQRRAPLRPPRLRARRFPLPAPRPRQQPRRRPAPDLRSTVPPRRAARWHPSDSAQVSAGTFRSRKRPQLETSFTARLAGRADIGVVMTGTSDFTLVSAR